MLDLEKIINNPYAPKLNNLVNFTDFAASAVDAYLVSPETPESEIYLFDTRGDEEINLESDITDNWVEANYQIQDHIGLKPITISLTGYIGELNNKPAEQLSKIEPYFTNLPLLGGPLDMVLNNFSPTLTAQAGYIYNRAKEVYGIYVKANESVGRIEDAYKKVPANEEATKQAQAFFKFKELWRTRTLSTIYTPFGAYGSMAIQSVRATQSGDGKYISEFQVSFKQIQIADSVYKKVSTTKFAGRTNQSMADTVDKGVQKPANNDGAAIAALKQWGLVK